jgi:uncharacterized membrane protein YcaP (DUF421 family)
LPSWIHIVGRSLMALVILFVLTRILGKKQISQLTFFEYVLGITLGDLAGFISTDLTAHISHGLLAFSVWFSIPFFLEMLALKNKTMRNWFEGKGTLLIRKGKILEENLKKERYSADELLEQLRTKSVFKVADVEFAMLEPSGDLSVMLKSEKQPLTAEHVGIRAFDEKPAETILMDGEIEAESLAAAGKSREWLRIELDKLGVAEEEVFVGQVDSYGELTVDLYDDAINHPLEQQGVLLLATLKKCEADMSLYALTSNVKKEQNQYKNYAENLKRMIEELEIMKSSNKSDLTTGG